MFENFPYTDMHQLNLDWIVKIAKDFLDQYTHIQEVIQTGLHDLAESRETGLEELNQKTLDGLADLQEKYDTLYGLLQAWYDTHSADIAGQLSTAINDFNAAAEAKSRALLDSWPADYSELVTEYNFLNDAFNYIRKHGTPLIADYYIENAALSLYNSKINSSNDSRIAVYKIEHGETYHIKRFSSTATNFIVSFSKITEPGDAELTHIMDATTNEYDYTNSNNFNYLYIQDILSGNESPHTVQIDLIPIVTEIIENVTENAGEIRDINDKLAFIKDYYTVDPSSTSATGIMKTNGTIDTSFPTINIYKYTGLENGVYYLNGSGMFDTGNSFCYVWRVKNDTMIDYIPVATKPQEFNHVPITIDNEADEIWIESSRQTVIILETLTAVDRDSREKIIKIKTQLNEFGPQWQGKKWYAYGTSITETDNAQQTGKYVPFLAQMSGMIATNKGIGGGGIGNLGAFSTGQVYDAICNITDGKLEADLITLETGANDISAAVPLGDVFDTGRDTLAGCLNDCIHYLQENTTAQIAIIPSPVGTQTSDKALQWAKMIHEICDINRVTFISPNDNLGRAKVNSNQGNLYLVDNIHQTSLGGYILAEYIWYQLRNIPLFYTSIPT